jgi:exodeoxyribonuclease VII small subunit
MNTAPEDPTATDPDEDPTGSEAGTAAQSAPSVEPVEAEGATQAEPLPEDIAALSYEAARDQLVEVVRRLESGQGGLEESIALWERGEMLARRCQQWLDGARSKLEEAVQARR